MIFLVDYCQSVELKNKECNNPDCDYYNIENHQNCSYYFTVKDEPGGSL